ncbi:hypothetical protein [Shouchella patagoniensis]|nr:hypothetical protein [Shouchella patagoniensis]
MKNIMKTCIVLALILSPVTMVSQTDSGVSHLSGPPVHVGT